jgi:hypothetical protein
MFCYRPLGRCKKCGRVHCISQRGRGCNPLNRCDNPRRASVNAGDPMEKAPHGFQVLQRAGVSPDEIARQAGAE